jgi:hypothetical protein
MTLLSATGCGLLPAAPLPAPFAPLPPASYGGSVRAEQILTISRAGGSSTLQAFVEVTPDKITVVGATALGQRVLSLAYDAQGLHVVPGPVSTAPAPEQVLVDLQLVTWPLPALQAAMAGTAWRIDEPRPGTRQVWRNGGPYAEIHYADRSAWEGRSWLVNLEHRYTLAIESRVLR